MKNGESSHYIKEMKNGTKLESINFIQSVMGYKFQYGCWFNVLKYPVRAYDKHDSPVADIKKTMHYCLFWLNDLCGNSATDFQDKLFDLFCDVEGVEKSKELKAIFDECVASTSSLEEAFEKFYSSDIWRVN